MDSPNILLAEDDIDDFQFFVEAFEKVFPGYDIARARNGLDCITYLKTQPKPNIVFMDLNIPVKNGLECLKFIKDNERLRDIPVIIYSTSHYIKHIDAAFKSGAHYYIVKPGNADLLAEVLTTVVNRLDFSLETPCKEIFVVRSTATLEN